MTKRFYVRYLEPRDNLMIHSSPMLVMSVSFNAGLNTSEAAGHRRKRDALAHVAAVNAAAGKPIAEYAGAIEPTSRW